MKAIIFGVTGQDGSHLADLLLEKNYQVVGVARRSSTDNTQRIKHILNHSRFQLVEGDITDSGSVANVLNNYEHVDEVYNLAAQSHVGTSFSQPLLTWDITGKGCLNILQHIKDYIPSARFYQASSSEMFGACYDIDREGNKYQDENTKFLPQSPYAIAKCAAHHSVRLYREAYNLHASCGILFNHEGPRRGDNFVTKKVINWLANFVHWMCDNNVTNTIYLDSDDENIIYNDVTFPKLMLGNLDSYRDWGYAGDYVEAMWLMLQQDDPDDYVICTEKTHSIRDLLDASFGYFNITNWNKYVGQDERYYRPSEVYYLKGKAEKARVKLGWTPKHDFNSLVKLMIEEKLNEKLSHNDRHIKCV
jgi:GDPmannose 4,6-dehydratase